MKTPLFVFVPADMAELEIDREDVHDRKKWRKKCYEEEVQPYRKTDYNYKPIIYIIYLTFKIGWCGHPHSKINKNFTSRHLKFGL